MTTLAACDGNWCPARELCERAAIYDASTSSHQTYRLLPREEQAKGVQCGHFVARETNRG